MKVTYANCIDNVNWQQVAAVFEAVGWGSRDPQLLEGAFNQSSHVRIAFCENQIVGFGRTTDDGHFYAMIVDLAVLPSFQGHGIGSKILTELKDELEGFLFTTLIAEPGKEPFYESQQWHRQSTAYIWPRSEQQRTTHASGNWECEAHQLVCDVDRQ